MTRRRRRHCRARSGGGRRCVPRRRDRRPRPTTPCSRTSPPRPGEASFARPPPLMPTDAGWRRRRTSTPPPATWFLVPAGAETAGVFSGLWSAAVTETKSLQADKGISPEHTPSFLWKGRCCLRPSYLVSAQLVKCARAMHVLLIQDDSTYIPQVHKPTLSLHDHNILPFLLFIKITSTPKLSL